MKRFKPLLIILTVLAVVAGACATVAVMGAANTPPVKVVVTPTPTPTPQPATKEELLRLVNEERAKVGVAPLVLDAKLEQSAQWKADKMTETGNLAHVDATTGRNDGLDYLDSLHPDCTNIGENLRWNVSGNNTALAAIDGWKSSAPHYKAMVSLLYTSTGFGISGTNIVEHFCQK